MNDLLNKRRLYWTLQIGGWVLYAIAQIVISVFASASQTISVQRVIFLVCDAFLCLCLTHGFRYLINEWKWMSLNLPRIVPRVLFGVFVLAVILYFIRIPVSISLSLFNPQVALSTQIIFTGIFTYAVFFFLWSVMYFIYNYFER